MMVLFINPLFDICKWKTRGPDVYILVAVVMNECKGGYSFLGILGFMELK